MTSKKMWITIAAIKSYFNLEYVITPDRNDKEVKFS